MSQQQLFLPVRRGKVPTVLLLSLIVNVGCVGLAAWLYTQGKLSFSSGSSTQSGNGTSGRGSSGNEAIPVLNTVSALGRIQPHSGLINVYGPTGDRVQKFSKSLGESVETKEKLGTLAGEADRKLQLDSLDAQIAEATLLKEAIEASSQAKLDDIDSEARQATIAAEQSMNALDAKNKAVLAQLNRAKKEHARLQAAKDAGVPVSAQEFEAAQSLIDLANAESEATLAEITKLKTIMEESKLSIASKKATVKAETKRGLAQVPLESLRTARRIAENKLQDGELRSPIDGKLVRILTQEGDTITTQPILQLIDPSVMTLTVEVYETDISRVREWLQNGKAVTAEATATVLGETKLRGTLRDANKISTVISKNILTPLGPREDADRRVVEVEVQLDAESARIAELYVSLQVRVTLTSTP